MERKKFMQLLGVGSGTLLLGSAFTHQFSEDEQEVAVQSVKIYDNYVRGTFYCIEAYEKTKPKQGDPLKLVREPNNKYDRFAIRVEKDGQKLGYIAAKENVTLAMLLDQGVPLTAQVENTYSYEEDDYYSGDLFSIEIFAPILVQVTSETPDWDGKRADDVGDIYRGK